MQLTASQLHYTSQQMHNVHHVPVRALVQAQHQKHAQRVVVVVRLQTTKECFRFRSLVVRAVAMASLLKTRVPHVGELELNVDPAK